MAIKPGRAEVGEKSLRITVGTYSQEIPLPESILPEEAVELARHLEKFAKGVHRAGRMSLLSSIGKAHRKMIS